MTVVYPRRTVTLAELPESTMAQQVLFQLLRRRVNDPTREAFVSRFLTHGSIRLGAYGAYDQCH
jgi:hypothetical protein